MCHSFFLILLQLLKKIHINFIFIVGDYGNLLIEFELKINFEFSEGSWIKIPCMIKGLIVPHLHSQLSTNIITCVPTSTQPTACKHTHV